jgi:anaerobic magnesium-protoporphyrin IX monomethyl ester cyclase
MNELPQGVKDLDREILAFIQKGVDHQDLEGFNNLALRTFEFQYEHIPLYKRYCQKRGIAPQGLSSWDQIPPLFTDVFKEAELFALPFYRARTFMTSGTTTPKERGRVYYDEGGLRLMDATISVAASAFLFPDEVKTLILIIAPSPHIAPHMIMAYGMDRLKDEFGLPQSRFLVGKEGFAVKDLVDELRRSEAGGIPITLCGGSSGFVNFFDYCRKERLRFQLHQGSRCLDAGGFKGRSREVEREEFLDYCGEFLMIPRNFCINLLGMTEIASQFYDNSLKNFTRGVEVPRFKVNPPWTKTLVVSPETLESLPPGEMGLLRHFDLANRGHICAIQTDDLGRGLGDGFEIYGRAEGGDAKGCSLTIDEMTRALEG